ncbi:TIGR02678 family protein [Intrasporangium sp. DVR]|uniref:TIGR02678 family protein n=1 Tax=Intrasporangium sp. DVR TaxID=3127867 RepID=UPI00313A7228
MTVERTGPPAAEDIQDEHERQMAIRALLRRPLLPVGHGHDDELRLIRRHRMALTRFFSESLGYRLTVDPAGARLFKAGLGRDGSRPLLRGKAAVPFTPRAYALLTLTIAALTRTKSQLLVDELVAAVRATAVEAGIEVDLDVLGERRALHAALLALVRFGALSERDGDLEHWAEDRTQSLLDVHRDVLGLLVAAPLSTMSTVDDLLAPAKISSAAGGARIETRRRLVESPILTTGDLAPDHAEWWARNRNREREWFLDQLGLSLELRAEGALALDPAEELTDLDFPGRGRTSHLALLLLESIVDELRPTAGAGSGAEGRGAWWPIPRERIESMARPIMAQWSSGLRRDQREDPAAAVAESLRLLASVGLVRPAPDVGHAGQHDYPPSRPPSRDVELWEVHAAACRYRPVAQLAESSVTGEASLFDLEGES